MIRIFFLSLLLVGCATQPEERSVEDLLTKPTAEVSIQAYYTACMQELGLSHHSAAGSMARVNGMWVDANRLCHAVARRCKREGC